LVRFKVDQNLPVEVAEALRGAGHDARTVYEQGLGGTLDPRLAEIVRAEARALVTLDVGLGDIRTYPPADYPGLIVLRPPHQDKPTVLRVFTRVLPLLERETLVGRLWIVDERRVRIRD
jgi:predicted nuclease of predicted toxin-antitoxin system